MGSKQSSHTKLDATIDIMKECHISGLRRHSYEIIEEDYCVELVLNNETPVLSNQALVKFDNNHENVSEEYGSDESILEINHELMYILTDVAALKKLAVDYSHPEVGIDVSDSTAFGRNYFCRPSAPAKEHMDKDEAKERQKIFADVEALKKLAADYAHPEVGVTLSDDTAFGRNYFCRLSSPVEEHMDEERQQILADSEFLKNLALDYAHPEFGVTVSDATVFGRNYFCRPSALTEEHIDESEAKERQQILADAASLKKLAVDYAHPVVGVTVSDSTVFGRSFFYRPSAPAQEHIDEGKTKEREQILGDTSALKKLAVYFAHPEVGITVSDTTVFGRNYFCRPSALVEEHIDESEAKERQQILADAVSLKKLAVDYAHPEVCGTVSDSTVFGRSFFYRPSAPAEEHIDEGNTKEHEQILEDAASLKKLAVDYAHPEVGVIVSNSTVFGRSFFYRPSALAEDHMDVNETKKRQKILADVATIKNLAVDFSHPEAGVTLSNSTALGRNHFYRPSALAEEHIDKNEAKERRQILADGAVLKKLAVDYAHPEVGVTVSDYTVFGRSFFYRPSALAFEHVGENKSKECMQILADASSPKKLAMDDAHPKVYANVSNKDVNSLRIGDINCASMSRSPSSVALFGLDGPFNS